MIKVDWKKPARGQHHDDDFIRTKKEELRDAEHRRVSEAHSTNEDEIVDVVNRVIEILNNLDLGDVQIPNPIVKNYPQID